MAVHLLQVLASGVTDDTGEPLALGTVYSYTAGTTTPQSLYEDYPCTEPHANPASLDAAGRLTAYANGLVKLVTVDADGAVVQSLDYVGVA